MSGAIAFGNPPVKLRQPTDFLILESLLSFGRNVAPNVAEITEKSRKNVNNRLPVLADYGLVRRVGPAERSGLYEITERGRVAVRLEDQYDDVDEFEALIERQVQTDDNAGQAVARTDESAQEPQE